MATGGDDGVRISSITTPARARAKGRGLDELTMWVIYDHPSDHPDNFVARRWLIGRGSMSATNELCIEQDIEHLRGRFRALGLTRLPRDPTEDAVIVEVWL